MLTLLKDENIITGDGALIEYSKSITELQWKIEDFYDHTGPHTSQQSHEYMNILDELDNIREQVLRGALHE